MPRVYIANDSYPELRDIPPTWARTVIWWRAIRRGFGHRDFWIFLATQAVCVLAFIAASIALASLPALQGGPERIVHAIMALGALAVFGYLQVSWGGDIMRSHLRGVSDVARHACPRCGHSLVGHLDGQPKEIRCPECAAQVHTELFSPPFRTPAEFRVFPPWRRSRLL